ncbi:MAG TPA: hypothetical protein VG637_07975, partial [Actinomycetes bacterium]|nr:hypothetical protein [Actinomycetes bacterium]
ELEDADLEAVAQRLGPDVLGAKELTVERDYSGRQVLLVGDQPVSGELATLLGSRLPRLLYFDGYSVLPGRVSIPRLQAAAEEDLQPGERTALALLRLAGVAAEDFVESEYEVRKAALESAATMVSEEVLRYWSQNPELAVELDLDFREAGQNGKGARPSWTSASAASGTGSRPTSASGRAGSSGSFRSWPRSRSCATASA